MRSVAEQAPVDRHEQAGKGPELKERSEASHEDAPDERYHQRENYRERSLSEKQWSNDRYGLVAACPKVQVDNTGRG